LYSSNFIFSFLQTIHVYSTHYIFYTATDTLLHYISPEIEWSLLALDERWRKQLKVVFRKHSIKDELDLQNPHLWLPGAQQSSHVNHLSKVM